MPKMPGDFNIICGASAARCDKITGMESVGVKGIAERMDRGARVVTVNRRLARSLAHKHDRAMMEDGRAAWTTPAIMPLAAWLESLWGQSWQDAALIDDVRSLALWERIIAADKDCAAQARSLAALAHEAHGIMREFRLALPRGSLYLSAETLSFKRWLAAYADELRRLGCIDRAMLNDRLIGLIKEGAVPLPPSIVFAGFDEFTPRMLELHGALRLAGTDVSILSGTGARGAAALMPCADEREEVRQAARFARRAAIDGLRVGIIVPELSQYRDLIVREFDAELDPASVLPTQEGDSGGVYNISLGLPLPDIPLVGSGLDILSLGLGDAPLERLRSVLRSPYFAAGDEGVALAGVDAALRDEGRVRARLSDVRHRVSGHPRLSRRIEAWLDRLKAAPKRGLPGFWAGYANDLLKEAGWLADATLNSAEYQALDAWNRLLLAFASLDDAAGGMTRQEAASKIASLASDTLHEPEGAECRVEVMGLLESTGLAFDHIRVMGGHEDAMPGHPRPNPFIPFELQRAAGVPRSSHERELAFARAAVDRILSSAPSITVTYPMRSAKDDKEMRPSPLFAGFPKECGAAGGGARLKDAVRSADIPLEDAPVDAPVPIAPAELPLIRGGTAILKDQSLCPFKAFALYRLNARNLAVPEPGIRPADRGSILHAALKRFWEKAVDSEGLRRLKDNGGLTGLAAALSEEVFKEVRLPGPVSQRLAGIEKERLCGLLIDWADKEETRGAFMVKAVEVKKEINVAGLPLEVRLDRVDGLSGGREVILDYKSGKTGAMNDLLNPRPRDPQLLVYSITGDCDAVSFARLVPGECRFVGAASADDLLPGVMRDKGRGWDALLASWRETVERLATEFMAGIAAVDPLEGEKTCDYCGLHVLCRVKETGAEDDGE
ncbi:MAG: PD-(D/E)XK nuclease family protein [Deltaproteobacteria bacterium]|nr:PD-(D/E)XK nuclease family protein [Deltaproteobacteria bacterium]